MKRIYFVRHGESEGNMARVEHADNGYKLTEKGETQARFLSKRLVNLPIDIIISSTYTRAMHTAEVINENLHKKMLTSDLLIERKIPTAFIGKETESDEVQEMYRTLRDNYHKRDARHSDEENFEDLILRAEKALDFIKNQPHENILVIAHSSFIRIMLSFMIFGKGITGEEFARTHRTFPMNNTGLSIVEHYEDHSKHKPEWKIFTWNDHAHLGEIKD